MSLSSHRVFGFWKEVEDYWKVKSSRFSVHEYIRKEPMPEKDKYCTYLWNALYLSGSRGPTPNAFLNSPPIMGGSSILTDRYWLWTRDTVIYIDEYNLWLPDAFRIHIENNNFEPTNYEDESERQVITTGYRVILYEEKPDSD